MDPNSQQVLSQTPRICPKCGALVTDPIAIYCPRCGADLFTNQRSVSFGRQCYVYMISLFAPPFGLVWVFKYLKSDNEKTKMVGWIALILTIVSIIVTIWLSAGIAGQIQQAMSSINSVQTGGGTGGL